MMVAQKCIEKVLHYYVFHYIFISLLSVVMYSLMSLKKAPCHRLYHLRSFSLQVTKNPTQILSLEKFEFKKLFEFKKRNSVGSSKWKA